MKVPTLSKTVTPIDKNQPVCMPSGVSKSSSTRQVSSAGRDTLEHAPRRAQHQTFGFAAILTTHVTLLSVAPLTFAMELPVLW